MNEENKSVVKSDSPEIEKAISNINTAWIAGVIIGGLSLIMSIVSLIFKNGATYSGVFIMFALWVLGFSYGIYKKSRICSIILLALWVIASVSCALNGDFITAFVGALLCYPFYKGLIGTLAYSKLDTVTKMMHKE